MRSFPEYRDNKADDGTDNENGTKGCGGSPMVNGNIHEDAIEKLIVKLSNHIHEIYHSITSLK